MAEKDSIYNYLVGRDRHYDGLEKQVNLIDQLQNGKEKEDLEKEIHSTVNKIQDRHGSLGQVRKQTISYLAKVIIEKVTPSHIRYLMFAAMQNNGYFEKSRG